MIKERFKTKRRKGCLLKWNDWDRKEGSGPTNEVVKRRKEESKVLSSIKESKDKDQGRKVRLSTELTVPEKTNNVSS